MSINSADNFPKDGTITARNRARHDFFTVEDDRTFLAVDFGGLAEEADTEGLPTFHLEGGAIQGADPVVPQAELDYHCHVPKEKKDKKARNQLIAVSVLCFTFMIAEIVGGYLSNSIAILTDATHLASDLTGFLISLLAVWIGQKPPTMRLSFGFYRAEVLGALTSIVIIWIATGVLVYLAIDRVIHPDVIDPVIMLITAGIGVAFNIIMGIVLHSGFVSCPKVNFAHGHSHGGHGHSHNGHGHSHGDSHGDNNNIVSNNNQTKKKDVNINVRAAFIHVIGDFIQSIGVLIAAIIIKLKPEYKIADPICTFIFSVLVLFTTITILKDAVLVLMEAVPRDVNYKNIRKDLSHVEGVKAIHSLHVWALTMEVNSAAVHLAVDPTAEWHDILKEATQLLREKHSIKRSTIQVEFYNEVIMSSCDDCKGPKMC